MMIGMGMLLSEVAERLHKKAHMKLVTAGWDRRIGIVMEDTQTRWQMTFSGGGASCGEWMEDQPADLVLRGQERELRMLFGGDSLVYAFAKQQVRMAGTLRDQLKLDTILRLTCR
jgi:hypothetical protein